MKNGNEGRDVPGGSRKRYRARGQRSIKIRTALRTNQIAGFVTVPSDKKINLHMSRKTYETGQIYSEVYFWLAV